MPIKINGTNTAANPSITGDDTDTGIVYGSDQIDFSTGGTSKVTLKNSNLGIGTTSPSSLFHVNSGTTNTCATFESSDAGAVLNITDNSARSSIEQNGTDLKIISDTDASDADSTIKFQVDASTRMQIHSSGLVTVGNDASGAATYGGQMVIATTSGGVLTCADTGSGERLRLEGGSGLGRIGTDSNHALTFITNGTSNERMRIDTSGNIGIGTSSPNNNIHVHQGDSGASVIQVTNSTTGSGATDGFQIGVNSSEQAFFHMREDKPILFTINGSERMRLTSDGNFLIGTTSGDIETLTSSGAGFRSNPNGRALQAASQAQAAASFNRTSDDGTVVQIRGQGNIEGTISVSGSAVSYNGGHLSRWSQIKGLSTTDKSARPTIYQGTVMSNLDDLCVWEGEDNQQLNMTKVSDVVGDKDVAGVFFTWDDDDDKVVNDFYVAMTGDMVIRVAASTTVARGDLLISAGDGTAKPQADDIVRSSTIAKIISTNHTATYADGSKAYPCLLMAC